MNVEIAPVVERRLGALPASAEFLRRLDVAGIIDGLCPVGEVAHLTHGQVIEVLVANRLSAPAPLVRVGDWAREWAVEDVFGITPDLLNDDRIARALDSIAPELEGIVGSVGASAITEFGIDVSRLHWDMTSMSLHGAYEHQEEAFPQVKYGHPKDRRADLKQIQAGIAISGDGGIPVFHRAYDGGAGEVSQVVGAMTALRKLASPRDFLMIGDSKLVSYSNLLALKEAGCGSSPRPPRPRSPTVCMQPLTSARPAWSTTPPHGTQEDHPGSAGATACWRTPRPWPVRASATRTSPCAGSWSIPAPTRCPAGRPRPASGAGPGGTGQTPVRLWRPALHHCREGHRPDRSDYQEAPYRLLSGHRRRRERCRTPHPGLALRPGSPGRRGGRGRLVRAADHPRRGRGRCGRGLPPLQGPAGHRAPLQRLQGPAAVAPVFLHHNRRIAALITVACLALLVFCLIERQVRQALGGDQTTRGLYPDNRAVRPTGRMILYHLASLRMRAATATDPPTILINRGVQAHLLELLGIDETRPRWLDTPHPMCEIRV